MAPATGMRRRFKSRYAVLGGLLASVGIVGLMAFAPSAAQAAPKSPPTTTTTLATSSGPPDYGTVSVPLPESFIAPGQALYAASCASCHGNDASGTARG